MAEPVCTSATRPVSPSLNMVVRETNTGRALRWSGREKWVDDITAWVEWAIEDDERQTGIPATTVRKLLVLHSLITTHNWSAGLRIPVQQCDHCADLCHSRSGLMCESPDAPWPCPTVRIVAEQFAGRRGYQERWRP